MSPESLSLRIDKLLLEISSWSQLSDNDWEGLGGSSLSKDAQVHALVGELVRPTIERFAPLTRASADWLRGLGYPGLQSISDGFTALSNAVSALSDYNKTRRAPDTVASARNDVAKIVIARTQAGATVLQPYLIELSAARVGNAVTLVEQLGTKASQIQSDAEVTRGNAEQALHAAQQALTTVHEAAALQGVLKQGAAFRLAGDKHRTAAGRWLEHRSV